MAMIKGWFEKFEHKLEFLHHKFELMKHTLCDRIERVEKKIDAFYMEVPEKLTRKKREAKKYRIPHGTTNEEEEEYMMN